jgi:hypothetical protein
MMYNLSYDYSVIIGKVVAEEPPVGAAVNEVAFCWSHSSGTNASHPVLKGTFW